MQPLLPSCPPGRPLTSADLPGFPAVGWAQAPKPRSNSRSGTPSLPALGRPGKAQGGGGAEAEGHAYSEWATNAVLLLSDALALEGKVRCGGEGRNEAYLFNTGHPTHGTIV